MEEVIFLPYDVHGALLTEDSKPLPGEKYLKYLGTVLPPYYLASTEMEKYTQHLLGRERPESGSYGW